MSASKSYTVSYKVGNQEFSDTVYGTSKKEVEGIIKMAVRGSKSIYSIRDYPY